MKSMLRSAYDVQWTSILCSPLLGHLTRASSPLAAASAVQFLGAVGKLQPSIFKAVLFICCLPR